MNWTMRPLFFIVLLWSSQTVKVSAQILYASTFIGFGNQNQILEIDLSSCTATPIVDVPPTPTDMCIAPNGLFYIVNTGINISSVDPATGIVTPVATLPNITASGLEWGEDGFLYAISAFVFKINPTTGVVQNMGLFPPGWVSTGELVYHNGIYYGAMNTPQGFKLVNVNLNNPAASTIITNMPLPFVGGGSINHPTCPKLLWIEFNTTADTKIWEYDITAQTWAIICDNIPVILGGGDTPNDYTFPILCSCTTNAGNVTAQNLTICGTANTATVPFTGGQTLDADDILRYIIFEDENDPEGSILLQSASPNIAFNPATMQTGQTYFLGTVAGNNLNGSVNLADPCLDFSGAFAEVVWQALPTVAFLGPPEVCAGGCQNFTANFTGTAPFTLTYIVTGGGQQSQAFNSSSGIVQICPPAGTAAGSFDLQAVGLSDANCSCL